MVILFKFWVFKGKNLLIFVRDIFIECLWIFSENRIIIILKLNKEGYLRWLLYNDVEI